MPKKNEFLVSTVTRDDLIERGFDGESLSDSTMEKIAADMHEYMLEYGGYWDALETVCERHQVHRLED